MDAYTNFIIKHRKLIITVFAVAAVICAICSGFVNVDYDLVDYLPDDAASTKSLDIMNEGNSECQSADLQRVSGRCSFL